MTEDADVRGEAVGRERGREHLEPEPQLGPGRQRIRRERAVVAGPRHVAEQRAAADAEPERDQAATGLASDSFGGGALAAFGGGFVASSSGSGDGAGGFDFSSSSAAGFSSLLASSDSPSAPAAAPPCPSPWTWRRASCASWPPASSSSPRRTATPTAPAARPRMRARAPASIRVTALEQVGRNGNRHTHTAFEQLPKAIRRPSLGRSIFVSRFADLTPAAAISFGSGGTPLNLVWRNRRSAGSLRAVQWPSPAASSGFPTSASRPSSTRCRRRAPRSRTTRSAPSSRTSASCPVPDAAARRAGRALPPEVDRRRDGRTSSTSRAWCAARPRARGSATSSWPTSARPTRSRTSCAASRTTTSSTSRGASIRSPTSAPSTPSCASRIWRRSTSGSSAPRRRSRARRPRKRSRSSSSASGCTAGLDAGKPVRAQGLTAEEQALVRDLGLLTLKKVFYVANVAEKQLAAPDGDKYVSALRAHAERRGRAGGRDLRGRRGRDRRRSTPPIAPRSSRAWASRSRACTRSRTPRTRSSTSSPSSPPAPTSAAPGPSSAAPRRRRRRASSTPTSSAASSRPR